MMPLDRRQFLASSSLAAALSAVAPRSLFGTSAQAAPPTPQTAFTPVRGTIGIFTGSGGTIGWHVDRSTIVAIDTQFPATAKTCCDGLLERSGLKAIDCLVITHHHGDHTAGMSAFKPVTKKILAHVNEVKWQRETAERSAKTAKPGAPPQAEQVYATATYEKTWREPAGSEVIAVKHYGPAHTSGDSIITFEQANVVHMGDLLFNRVHPYIDKAAGASIANWMTSLDAVAADHDKDTIYIFGHSGGKFPVTGGKAELAYMRDYLSALLEFVRGEIKAGKPRETIVRITDPLKGFPDHGPLLERVLSAAYDELHPA
jgi:cyclase